jgi:hypothetical protein
MVDTGGKDEGAERGHARALWRRAPAWRWTVTLAILASIATVGLWLNDQATPTILPAPEATPATPSARQMATAAVSPAAQAPVQSPAVPPPAPEPVTTAAPVPMASSEEEQREARCHPGLVGAPIVMPQINVAAMADPGIGHMKVHMWINGAGMVLRDVLTASSYGTPEEQQAELAYTSKLTFAVPQKPECASREIELIGDFFQHRGGDGRWATFIRVYPRFYFDPPGVLVRRD